MANWAALFDWDGVIIDSSRQHEAAWQDLAAEERRRLPGDFFRRSFGMKNQRAIPELLGWTQVPNEIERLAQRKEALYRERLKQDRVVALPGLIEWLDALRTANVSCAIASSTPRININVVIDQLKLRPYFPVIVTGEDVTLGKPHPEVFLRAAGLLACSPSRCVVFEDAHVGLAAAHAAGMRVVALATTHAAESLTDADLVVHSADELHLDAIAAWFE